jgi:hypothetical protein
VFKQSVERWRPFIRQSFWGGNRATEDFTLANLWKESKGNPGAIGYTDVPKSYTDEELSCGWPVAYRRRALGLMQVAPTVVRTFNERFKHLLKGGPVTPCVLGGKTPWDCQRQIDIGLWAESLAWKEVTGNATPGPGLVNDKNILMVRLCYHAGRPSFKQQLTKTMAAGFPGTFEGMELFNPKWGHPDRPFDGARELLAVYKKAIAGGPSPIVDPIPPEPIPYPIPVPPDPGKATGGLALLVLGGLALLALAAGARGPRSTT